MSLGAVLPLCIRGSYDIDDLGRTEILFRSLRAFAAPGTFGTILVVTPPNETALVGGHCQRCPEFNIEVISEEELVPELASHRHVRGWRKQQMIKLAAARVIGEKFYLTLDADVICLRPFDEDDLVIDGRALLQYEMRSQHPKWWKSSARLLNMDPDVGDPEIGMTVTPAILARDLSLQVAEDLQGPNGRSWVETLCVLHNPRRPYNWTPARFRKARWTEYSLYYLCAMKHGRLDEYHIRAGTDKTPQLLLVHDSHPFENWDPAVTFAPDAPGLFCVVGSKSRLEPETVWKKVGPFIPGDSTRPAADRASPR